MLQKLVCCSAPRRCASTASAPPPFFLPAAKKGRMHDYHATDKRPAACVTNFIIAAIVSAHTQDSGSVFKQSFGMNKIQVARCVRSSS